MGQLHKPGEIVAKRYCILNVLGEGGSGVTYRAKDLKEKEQVALKALSLRQIKDWKNIDRFEREARVLAQLKHPAIPRYLDYFQVDAEEDRAFYITQQLAEGESLETWINKGWHATERDVRNIAEQILEVLVYLHSLNPPIVHRDIKPQNIIRQPDGRVFLVDFGAVQEIYHSTLARSSTVAGTFGYMAPEQFMGQAVPGSDLYGLGATLLFLLTHRSPAELPTNQLKIDFRDRVRTSEAFADILEKLLEPDLDNRFSSATEALKALRDKKSQQARSIQRKPTKVLAGLAIGTVVTVLLFEGFKYPLMSTLGFTPYPFYTAIRDNDLETARTYLDKGIRINTRDARNSSPLHWSVSNNSVDVAQLLIERGANIHDTYDAYQKDAHTVLHTAVHHDTKEMAKLLLDFGAKVNARNAFGQTPLHSAIIKKGRYEYYGMDSTQPAPALEVLELLVARGADVDAKDNSGQTPLDYAKEYGYNEVIAFLKRHGGN
ncbi:ankyrin repeat domain-containing protein [Lusitaniella coriacea LEGE 07157]|uniref:non-specific serine/threonine protein kinase n=1 Tax=Lusitaniella coriacea LEGE 07157 TaxID=945747 RepID=A0A8J7E046_9CYAN|nr:ankyrin repeat domain-containing protein [Lusitaniella coriacea]MBE9118971.1 ankyrin repeat domain-containing protein [Lusitaniella coriacea LEGE 07157]